MTINEMVVYLWELAGEPSDNDVFADDGVTVDQASSGYNYYIRELTKAQNTLANWRTSRGRPIRFSKFLTRKNVKLGLDNFVSTGVTKVDDYSVAITDPPSLVSDEYIDTRLDVTIVALDFDSAGNAILDSSGIQTSTTYNQSLMVVYVEDIGGVLNFTFQDKLENTDNISYTMSAEYKFTAFKIIKSGVVGSGYTVNLPAYSRNITSLTLMSTGQKLDRASAKTKLYDYIMTEGTPIQWYKTGEVLYMDSYIADPTWFIVDYQRLPFPVTPGDTNLDIPTEWEDVILMFVELSEAKRMQEVEKATILRSQLNSLINQLRTDDEEDWLTDETEGFYVQMEAK